MVISFFIVLSIGRPDDVGKNARSRHFSPGTCSLDHQRLFGISVGIKQNDIVFTVQVEKIVCRSHMLQADRSFSILIGCYEFQFFPFRRSSFIGTFQVSAE